MKSEVMCWLPLLNLFLYQLFLDISRTICDGENSAAIRPDPDFLFGIFIYAAM